MSKKGFTTEECIGLMARSLKKHLGIGCVWVEELEVSLDSAGTVDGTGPVLLASRDGARFDLITGGSVRFPVNAIIRDPELDTVGLVILVGQHDKEENRGDDEDVKDFVEQAAYLRHLLDERSVASAPKTMVEVVLVALRWDQQAETISEALRDISAETSILHSIGVSLLRADQHGKVEALHRAFSFLLTETRKHFRGIGGADVAGSRKEDLLELVTRNFRVRGERRWCLEPQDGRDSNQLIVIHGPNGSGKSSLVEAIELMVTGSIERVDREIKAKGAGAGCDYPGVLTHGGKDGGLEITLAARFSDSTELREFSIGAEGVKKPLAPGFGAPRFRLDQRMSGRLIFGTPGERAAILLEAFFPEESSAIRTFKQAEERRKTALVRLPAGLLSHYGAPASIPAGWWEGGEIRIPQAYSKVLGKGHGNAGFWLERVIAAQETGQSFSMDQAWAAFFGRIDTDLASAEVACFVLERLSNWKPRGIPARVTAEQTVDFAALHNEWLHLLALSDLMRRDCEVTRIVVKAQSLGWKPQDRYSIFFPDRTSERLQAMESQLDAIKVRLEELDGLLSFMNRVGEESSDDQRTRLDVDEIAALNWVGRLVPSSRTQSLGATMLRMMEGDVDENGEAGMRDLVHKVRKEAEDLTKSLRFLADHRHLLSAPPGEVGAAIDALKVATKELESGNTSVLNALQERISGPVSRMLNELMAIMTPARWAYEDVALGTTGDELSMDSGGLDVAVKLNTAELNTLTLAMFLSLAMGREDNPLRMVVLDDPFENMDELTTITVARAINRLDRLWRRNPAFNGWRLVLMLHGAENVERIREEVPCDVFFLPWLLPLGVKASADTAAGKIVQEASKLDLAQAEA